MTINRTVGIIGAVALVVIGLGVFATYAFAQSERGGAWRGGPPWTHRGAWGGWHGDGWRPDPEQVQQARTDLAADLATELDTSPAQVEAAFRAVVAERLQEAVDAGRFDRAAADEALAAYDEGDIRAVFDVLRHDRPSDASTPS